MRLLLLLKLLSELGIGLLKILDIVLEKPRLACLLQLQLLQLPLKEDVLHLFLTYMFLLRMELLEATLDFSEFV